MKRWGNRRKPAKRHGRVESPDSDPILDPRAPIRAARPAKSLHASGSHRANRGEAGLQTVHRLPVQAGRFCQRTDIPRESGSALNGVRYRLGTESSAWRLLSCMQVDRSHSGIRACSVQYNLLPWLLNCVQSLGWLLLWSRCRRHQWAQCASALPPQPLGRREGGWGHIGICRVFGQPRGNTVSNGPSNLDIRMPLNASLKEDSRRLSHPRHGRLRSSRWQPHANPGAARKPR